MKSSARLNAKFWKERGVGLEGINGPWSVGCGDNGGVADRVEGVRGPGHEVPVLAPWCAFALFVESTKINKE